MTLTVPVPTSKSITQRALLIAGLASGPSIIERPLDCDDSRYLRAALEALGARIDWRARHHPLGRALVTPAPLPLAAPAEALFCGNAGTAVRFSAALSLLCRGTLVIDGDEHMRRRPIAPLAASLERLGVSARYLGREGCPPISLTRRDAPPGRVEVDATLSSQYASGILMVAPLLDRPLEVALTGEALVSRPYLEMTVALMRRAGAEVGWRGEACLRVAPSRYRPHRAEVEVDWSAAAFILAAARITGRDIVPRGMADPADSLQGDAAIAAIFAELDRRGEVNEIDLTDAPDLIAPITAAALFASRPTRIRGAAHTRIKECDRVHVLARELAKLGADIRERPDGLDIAPRPLACPNGTAELDPEDDHRMAMTFGLVSLRLPGIRVKNPACVSKSFPDFWQVLDAIRRA